MASGLLVISVMNLKKSGKTDAELGFLLCKSIQRMFIVGDRYMTQLERGALYNKIKLMKKSLANLAQLQKLKQKRCKSSVEGFEE